MYAWRVVNFPKEDTVEAVPVSWIRGFNQCHWPPFSGLKLKIAITKCMPPCSNWDVHEARIIGEVYGDLSVARMKALEAETTSDLNSDNDSVLGLGHRKIRTNRKYQDSDSEQEKEDTPSPELPKLVMPTLKRREKKNSVSPSNDEIWTDSNSGSKNSVPEKTSCSGYDPENQLDISIPFRVPIKPPSKVIEVSSNNNSKDEQFRRQVLRSLSIINFKLDQLAEDVSRMTLKEKEEVINVPPSVFLQFNFPLSTEGELHSFENYLADGEKYKQVQLELSRIGGGTTKIIVKRLLDKLISNQLGVDYSWIGFKKKRNFSVLLTAKVLIDAVMAVHQKANAAEVEVSAKQWLFKCRERMEKENK